MGTDELKERLRSHLNQLARERDPYLATEGHFFVQHYIRAQLAQWGPVDVHEFMVGQRCHTNLILNIDTQSAASPKAPILIGAHYDAVPGTPGADDNATGVAALLEIARSLATSSAKYPMRFVAFDMEESGLLGSKHYAADLFRRKEPVRLMLSLEMLGYCSQEPDSQRYPAKILKRIYPTTGHYIGLIGNLPTLPDLWHLSRHIHQAGVASRWLPIGMRGKIIPASRRSDHAPFWDWGYRAMMVTDTADLRNPHYHLPSDRIDTLDLDFLTGICQGLIQGLQTLP